MNHETNSKVLLLVFYFFGGKYCLLRITMVLLLLNYPSMTSSSIITAKPRTMPMVAR